VITEDRSGGLTVEVTDDGLGAAATAPETPGHGLAGMRERAATVGGSVTAGPRAGGGFRVEAHLPTSEVVTSR
jgi:signal transduction histidine kinase